jgi:hypothetical protein
LRAILDASTLGEVTYLVTEFDKPFTANGFGNRSRSGATKRIAPRTAYARREPLSPRKRTHGTTIKSALHGL